MPGSGYRTGPGILLAPDAGRPGRLGIAGAGDPGPRARGLAELGFAPGFAQVSGSSVVAHAGLVLYGSTVPSVFRAFRSVARDPASEPHIRQIRVSPVATRVHRQAAASQKSMPPGSNFAEPLTGSGCHPLSRSGDRADPADRIPVRDMMRSEAKESFEHPDGTRRFFLQPGSLAITQAIPAGAVPPITVAPDPGPARPRPQRPHHARLRSACRRPRSWPSLCPSR